MKYFSRIGAGVARLKLSHQLFGAFAVLLVVSGLIGAAAMVGLTRVHHAADDLVSNWLPAAGELSKARVSLLAVREFESKHARSTDVSYFSEYEEKMAEQSKAVDAALATFDKLAIGDEERKHLDAVRKGWAEYQQAKTKVIALGRAKETHRRRRHLRRPGRNGLRQQRRRARYAHRKGLRGRKCGGPARQQGL